MYVSTIRVYVYVKCKSANKTSFGHKVKRTEFSLAFATVKSTKPSIQQKLKQNLTAYKRIKQICWRIQLN